MKEFGKQFTKKMLRLLNLKLSYYDQSHKQYIRIIENIGVNLVLDIGANVGQFAYELLDANFTGRIVSFEPTKQAFEVLAARAAKHDNWVVHERAALGDRQGETIINVAGNAAASSSILGMQRSHEESSPESRYVDRETVKLTTLDSVFLQYVHEGDTIMLKLDVQGYEDTVLKGASSALKRAKAVKIECSLMSLYEGDRTYEYYFDFFQERGFTLFDIEPGHSHPGTGRLLQFDALFVRN